MPDRPDTLGHTDLVDELAQRCHLPRTIVSRVLAYLTDVVSASLTAGHRVRIRGLGTLSAVPTAARSGRGPDGRPYSVPAGRRVRLAPDAALSRTVDTPPEAA